MTTMFPFPQHPAPNFASVSSAIGKNPVARTRHKASHNQSRSTCANHDCPNAIQQNLYPSQRRVAEPHLAKAETPSLPNNDTIPNPLRIVSVLQLKISLGADPRGRRRKPFKRARNKNASGKKNSRQAWVQHNSQTVNN